MAAEPPHILVIDDLLANRAMVEAYLVAAGYAVDLAASGEDGLVEFARAQPDLVLLDILMPGLDGFATCARLKALPGGGHVPVLFLTALDDPGAHQQALDAGADDFLTKPVHRTELLIRVRSLLRIRRLQRKKDELAALLVHDLRSPLMAILFNVQLVAEAPGLDDADRSALFDVQTAAESIHRMVANLLDISRSEDGALVPKLDEIAVGALVHEVCAAFRGHGADRRLAVTAEVTVPRLRADPDLLRRLLENLVDNAFRYTPTGGTIRVVVEPAGPGEVELRVEDDGPGVPAADRERIFEKYYQVEVDVGARVRTSRGLGLAFCRLAAEAHGGRIWVDALAPRGSAFRVRLPAPELDRFGG